MSRHYLRSLTRIFAVAILSFISYRLLNTATEPSRGNSAKFRPKRELPIVHEPVLLNETLADSKQSGDNAHGLFRRALHPECSNQEFEVSQNRGCQIRSRLTTQEGVAEVFHIATRQDLQAWGWQQHDPNPAPDMNLIAPFLKDLAGVDGHRVTASHLRVMFRAGEYVARTWSHFAASVTMMPDGTIITAPATDGTYRQISAPGEGVIVILSSWTPESMTSYPDAPMPYIHTWEQVGQADYDDVFATIRTNSIAKNSPRIPSWILIDAVSAPNEALGVITRCLRQAHGLTALPDWNHRATFAIGTTCFDALLGTQKAMPVGWLHIAKRRTWQTKIWSITLFDSGKTGVNGYNLASMLFFAVRRTVDLEVAANEEFQAAADAQHRAVLGVPPHPFTPRYYRDP